MLSAWCTLKWVRAIGSGSHCKYTYVIVFSCIYLFMFYIQYRFIHILIIVCFVCIPRTFPCFCSGSKRRVVKQMRCLYLSKASYGLANLTENIRSLEIHYRSEKKKSRWVHAVGTKSKLTNYDYSSSSWAVKNVCVCIKANLNLNTYINSRVYKIRNLQLTNTLCHVMDVSRGGG